jgi:hypothetical protein
MSLPARQERILSRMAHSLHASEPHLTSMFAIFTKLARDEDTPRLEALDAWSLPFWGWRQRLTRPRRTRRAASGTGAAHARGARLRAILLVPIMLAALAPAVFLGLGGRSVSRYGPAACPQYTKAAPGRHGAFLSVPQRLACQRLPDG